MKKMWGIIAVFAVVCVAAAMLNEAFLSPVNLENLIMRIGLYGILAVGVAFVIMTGGIDLSIGSVVCLVGCGLPWLLVKCQFSAPLGLLTVTAVVVAIGFWHGFLIARVRLQAFIVTLCGLLIYRGVMRGLVKDQSQGFGNQFREMRFLATGQVSLGDLLIVLAALVVGWLIWQWRSGLRWRRLLVLGLPILGLVAWLGVSARQFPVPMPFVLLLAIAGIAALFLNYSVWGQHLLALGNNEEAARYSGIATRKITIAAYVICSVLAGLAGLLFIMDVNSAQPSDFGNFYELYAIAAAVLGGCSLRGGQGAIFGVLIGTALLQVLRNIIVLIFPSQQNMEFAVIGVVILCGVIGDVLLANKGVLRSKQGGSV